MLCADKLSYVCYSNHQFYTSSATSQPSLTSKIFQLFIVLRVVRVVKKISPTIILLFQVKH